ncbi:MAG TPA: PPK2 family polyphosphate kinase [Actinoplanes sp.]|nr:PPK2 family polyphosphate kinase [Actinoplanes sp.]
MTDLRELLVVRPDEFRLADVDPDGTPGLPDDKAVKKDPKRWSSDQVSAIVAELDGYQGRLFASARKQASDQRVLVVLQAMDCGGKDGTVRKVFRGVNPIGIDATSFGPPDDEERKHDFLWRIRRALPPAGYVGIFNRSHYEDVLVVRVHNLVPEDVWSQRYDQINAFEAEQVASGLTMVKVMLHISPDEQKKRLLARLDDPAKRWKYNPGDLAERSRWAGYMEAYQDALTRCGTDAAPWYVVPANRKWYRNWAVAMLVRQALAGLDPHYPEPDFDVAAERQKVLAA